MLQAYFKPLVIFSHMVKSVHFSQSSARNPFPRYYPAPTILLGAHADDVAHGTLACVVEGQNLKTIYGIHSQIRCLCTVMRCEKQQHECYELSPCIPFLQYTSCEHSIHGPLCTY